jgi:hypothetical protein
MTLVWPSFLLGEARRHEPMAAPRPVFVAVPHRLREAGNREVNPGEALVVASLYRTDDEDEPTHAEVLLADGSSSTFGTGWLVFDRNVVALRPLAPPAKAAAACTR